jgi:small subunit ribosomal protein S2
LPLAFELGERSPTIPAITHALVHPSGSNRDVRWGGLNRLANGAQGGGTTRKEIIVAVTMKQLLEAGVHFGHQTRRWNPKMAPYIYGERNGIHIIDLRQTLDKVNAAAAYAKDLAAKGGVIMFIGTKKQAQSPIADAAQASGMPYVNYRWLGGMLTNFQTIQKRIYYMRELENMETSGEMEARPKKERLRLRRELGKLQANLGGVRNLTRVPDAVFLVDVNAEHTAVREAQRLGLKTIALVDSNCDPDAIDIVIPGNDDAIRSAELIAMAIAEGAKEGRELASKKKAADESEDS